MVIPGFLVSIRTITYTVTLVLFGTVLLFFVISVAFQLLKALVIGMRAHARRGTFRALIDYLLGQSELADIADECRKRNILMDGFATLISSIRGQKQERMMSAVNALGLGEYLHSWLHHVFPSRRMRACYLLGLMKSRTSADELVGTLADLHPSVVSAAIIAIGEIGDERMVPALVRYFEYGSFAHAWLIAAILPTFGEAVYEHIRPSLLSEALPKEKKVLLLKVITTIRIGESLPDLRNLYERSDDTDIRVNALKAIGRINDLATVMLVFNALSDESWVIRAVACSTLGEMSLKGAAYRLIPLLRDEKYHVRKNAAQALLGLGQIGVTALVNYLEIEDSSARDVIVQALEEGGVVDRALKGSASGDPQERKLSRQILRAIVQKGYTKYISNFTSSHALVRELLSE